MRTCPKCGTAMVRWGNPPTQRWRCPPCSQIRRDSYHTKTLIDPGAPRRQLVEVDASLGMAASVMTERILAMADELGKLG